jgi:hypothetical protein
VKEKAKAMEKKDATIITILMTIITCHTIKEYGLSPVWQDV